MTEGESSSTMTPRVSVIIPTYNRAHLVNRAIQSVLNQSYQDFEVIVVDDGSTDNTADVVSSVGDERVRYIRHQVNKGTPAAARNTGIRAASGELIGFLDSDDEWLLEKLQRQVDKFDSASPSVGLIYGGYIIIDDDSGKMIGQVYPRARGYVFREVLDRSGPTTPLTTLVKRECFEKVGVFDEDMRFGEDLDMWVRIAQHYEFGFVSEAVAKHHLSRDQITSDRGGVLRGVSEFMAKHKEHILEDPAILAGQLRYAGQMYLIEREYATARSYFAQAVRANPRGVRLYFHLLAAWTVPRIYRAVLSNTRLVLSFNKCVALIRKFARIG